VILILPAVFLKIRITKFSSCSSVVEGPLTGARNLLQHAVGGGGQQLHVGHPAASGPVQHHPALQGPGGSEGGGAALGPDHHGLLGAGCVQLPEPGSWCGQGHVVPGEEDHADPGPAESARLPAGLVSLICCCC